MLYLKTIKHYFLKKLILPQTTENTFPPETHWSMIPEL